MCNFADKSGKGSIACKRWGCRDCPWGMCITGNRLLGKNDAVGELDNGGVGMCFCVGDMVYRLHGKTDSRQNKLGVDGLPAVACVLLFI